MVDVNTTVFNKQLEELENLADGGSLYEDQQEDDEEEVQAEPSLEWRRLTLEESLSRVKRAKGRPVDPSKVYEIGTLLFEPAEGKFGRVKRSVPGYLCIQFLRGGEREYGRRPDVETYLRDHHRGKTAAELALQLGFTETEVQGHLNRLGLIRVDAIPGLDAAAVVPGADPVPDERKDAKVARPRPARGARDIIPGLSGDEMSSADSDDLALAGESKLPKPTRSKSTHKIQTEVPVEAPPAKSKLPAKAKDVEEPAAEPVKPVVKSKPPIRPKAVVVDELEDLPPLPPAPKSKSHAKKEEKAEPSKAPVKVVAKTKAPAEAHGSHAPQAAHGHGSHAPHAAHGSHAPHASHHGHASSAPKPAAKAAKSQPPTKKPEVIKTQLPKKADPKSKPPVEAKTGERIPQGEINGFIAENYQRLSNREIAERTGLSEHTVRRKLGEWGLKRSAAQKE